MNNKELKKKRLIRISFILVLMLFTLNFIGCASWSRACVDMKSEISGGLEREIYVYTADGQEIDHFKGKIDIESNEGGEIKFDFEGKRYIYYNCLVKTVAEID